MSSTRNNVLAYMVSFLSTQLTTGNGYNFTVGTVERGLKYPENIPQSGFPALFVSSTDEARTNITRRDFKAVISANLVGYVKIADGVSGLQDELDKFIEDVAKAVEVDRTQDGNVHWTTITRIRTDDGDSQEYAAFVMQVDFHYAAMGSTP